MQPTPLRHLRRRRRAPRWATPAPERDSRRIGVTGATGFTGSALLAHLERSGHRVVRFVRSRATATSGDMLWNPDRGELDPSSLDGLDAVVHLAGEPIGHRWTSARKTRIVRSRLDGTRLLAERIASRENPPPVLVSASAVGFYGDRGDELLDETSSRGSDFLAEVAGKWEGALAPARERGVRVVNARFGIVLSRAGGALGRMLLPFRLGVGGPLGSGNQWMSWIGLNDAVRAIEHALRTDSVQGPVNVVSPNPVTSAEFARALGRVLHRPAIFPVPAFVLRAMFGEMADATLLAGQRVEPRALRKSGFEWEMPRLEEALRKLLESQN